MLLLHGLPCLNEAVNTVIFMFEIHVYFCTYTLILTGTLQIHGVCFHSYTLHFVSYHSVGQKLVAMTYGGSIYMYVCMYVSAHACLYVCTSHVPSLCLDRF